MTTLWTTPIDWETQDAITAEKLNAISDNLQYLMTPNFGVATMRGTGSNQTTASGTFVDLDPATYSLDVELTGLRAVKFSLLGIITHSVGGSSVRFDVLIDGTTYLSSLTATPLVNGVSVLTLPAGELPTVYFEVIVPAGVIAAGRRNFRPVWSTTAATATWYEISSSFSQFRAGEY